MGNSIFKKATKCIKKDKHSEFLQLVKRELDNLDVEEVSQLVVLLIRKGRMNSYNYQSAFSHLINKAPHSCMGCTDKEGNNILHLLCYHYSTSSTITSNIKKLSEEDMRVLVNQRNLKNETPLETLFEYNKKEQHLDYILMVALYISQFLPEVDDKYVKSKVDDMEILIPKDDLKQYREYKWKQKQAEIEEKRKEEELEKKRIEKEKKQAETDAFWEHQRELEERRRREKEHYNKFITRGRTRIYSNPKPVKTSYTYNYPSSPKKSTTYNEHGAYGEYKPKHVMTYDYEKRLYG